MLGKSLTCQFEVRQIKQGRTFDKSLFGLFPCFALRLEALAVTSFLPVSLIWGYGYWVFLGTFPKEFQQ